MSAGYAMPGNALIENFDERQHAITECSDLTKIDPLSIRTPEGE
jgi:hypothetical protein